MTGIFISKPGKRSELIAILKRAAELTSELPGCRLYLVSEDVTEDSLAVVFEMWDDKDAHDESLKGARVRELIAEAMPLLSGPPSTRELRVVGGLKAE